MASRTCIPHAEALRETLGVRLVQFDLDTLFEQARAADPAAVEAVADALRGRLANLDALDAPATRGTLAAYVACAIWLRKKGWRGWRCAAAAVLHRARVRGVRRVVAAVRPARPGQLRTDVNGAATLLLLQALSGGPRPSTWTWSASILRRHDGRLALGKAPLSMADPALRRVGRCTPTG